LALANILQIRLKDRGRKEKKKIWGGGREGKGKKKGRRATQIFSPLYPSLTAGIRGVRPRKRGEKGPEKRKGKKREKKKKKKKKKRDGEGKEFPFFLASWSYAELGCRKQWEKKKEKTVRGGGGEEKKKRKHRRHVTAHDHSILSFTFCRVKGGRRKKGVSKGEKKKRKKKEKECKHCTDTSAVFVL